MRASLVDRGRVLGTNLGATRSLIHIKGKDSFALLQALISCDLRKLPEREARSAVLLTNKGRLIGDFLAWKTGSTNETSEFYLDCDSQSSETLAATIKKARFRKVVEVAVLPEAAAWNLAACDSGKNKLFGDLLRRWSPGGEDAGVHVVRDPRPGLAERNLRLWFTSSAASTGLLDKVLTPDGAVRTTRADEYHQRRIFSGIPEGKDETSDSTPFVLNMDLWPGTLAYDKGCYVGQELVARTHFKGVVRKRLLPVVFGEFSSVPDRESIDDLAGLTLPEFAWRKQEMEGVVPGMEVETLDETKGNEVEAQALSTGTLVAVAPLGPRADVGPRVGLVAMKGALEYAQIPDIGMQPTHRIKREGKSDVLVTPFRPDWWPPLPPRDEA